MATLKTATVELNAVIERHARLTSSDKHKRASESIMKLMKHILSDTPAGKKALIETAAAFLSSRRRAACSQRDTGGCSPAAKSREKATRAS